MSQSDPLGSSEEEEKQAFQVQAVERQDNQQQRIRASVQVADQVVERMRDAYYLDPQANEE